MADCPSFYGNGVTTLIEGQVDKLFGYGKNAYDTSMSALQAIEALYGQRFSPNPAELNLDISNPTLEAALDLPDFEMPLVPESPELLFDELTPLSAPPNVDTIEVNFPDAPEWTGGTVPSLNLPTRPGVLSAARPDAPSELILPEYPGVPTYAMPAMPTLESLNLPHAPTLDVDAIMAEFALLYQQRPQAPDIGFSGDFLTLLDQQYALVGNRAAEFVAQCPALANLCPRLGELLSGNSTGLAVGVETALRDRAFAAEERLVIQAEQQALNEWLSRGFTLPNGALDTKLATIRQQAWDKKSTLSRDIWIESAKMEIENLRFAITQGIALEGQYWDHFTKLYGLSQSIVTSLFDVEYKIISAYLEAFKTEVAAWQSQAEFFKAWLQAELSKLEIFKSQLDGQRLLGEINQQAVNLYKTQWDGVMSQVTLYKGQIDAANSRLQGELARIDLYKSQMQAYSIEVGAYETEWKAYTASVQGELGKAEFYDSLTKAYSSRVAAYQAQTEAERSRGALLMDTQKLRLEGWAQQAKYYETQLNAEIARIEAGVKVFSAQTGLFSAEVQGESARSDVAAKEATLRLQKDRNSADIRIEEAKLAMTETLESSKIAVQAMGDIGRIASQLSAGALSALNMSAQLQSSSSTDMRSSCSVSYNIDE